MIAVPFIIHAGFPSWEVRKNTKKEQLDGKERMSMQVNVDGVKVQQMEEDDRGLDDAMFHGDPDIPGEKCV